jgi:hypothetical protein
VGVVVVAAPGLPGLPRRADHGGGEAVHGRAEGVGGDGGQVEQAAARLGPVDLLQAEDVGVEVGDGGGDAFGVDGAVGQRPAVQQVEGGQAHGPDLNEDLGPAGVAGDRAAAASWSVRMRP